MISKHDSCSASFFKCFLLKLLNNIAMTKTAPDNFEGVGGAVFTSFQKLLTREMAIKVLV